MTLELDLQLANESIPVPDKNEFEVWVKSAIENMDKVNLTIRIVDETESKMLNETYRKKTGATNVLSFPAETREFVPELLGDIVICAEKVINEAEQQNKNVINHWAHLVIHGVLHLLGYDHINDTDAEVMEAKEIAILKSLGYENPYLGH